MNQNGLPLLEQSEHNSKNPATHVCSISHWYSSKTNSSLSYFYTWFDMKLGLCSEMIRLILSHNNSEQSSAVKVVENNGSFSGSVFGQLWKSPFLNTSTSHTSNYYALMMDGNLHHLWWARARFPEEMGGWCPGCSTCSSAWRWKWSCGRASSATCWHSLGKTGPAPPQRAHRPAHPVSCPGAVLDKVTPNLSRANILHQTL